MVMGWTAGAEPSTLLTPAALKLSSPGRQTQPIAQEDASHHQRQIRAFHPAELRTRDGVYAALAA